MISLFGYDHPNLTNKYYVLLVCCAFFLPLSFAQNLSKYQINSFLATISVVGLGIVSTLQATAFRSRYPEASKVPEDLMDNATTLPKFLAAFGGLSYMFVCHDLSFNVFTSLKNPTRKRWGLVTVVVMLMTVGTFFLIGFSGFSIKWHDISDNFVKDFPAHDPLAITLRILLIVNIVISLPYLCFMPRVSVYSMVTLFTGTPDSHRKVAIYNAVITLSVVFSGVGLAMVVPRLGDIYQLFGGFAAAAIAFVIPTLLFLRLEKGSVKSNPKKSVAMFVMVAGVLLMIGATTSVIYDMTISYT
eukprot:TRINITY_DN7646_c0_g1_i2.p1 TRINITY_DN7646_c0_g1~~TRINITY_DN7646_c0_g1_i2.p1  ORF type:complete len:301 (+),score=61.55 TRINITY_DN7646_c0_g1_i2:163-1065(+)